MLVTAVVWWQYRWLRGGDGGGVMVSAVRVAMRRLWGGWGCGGWRRGDEGGVMVAAMG
ncbi:hypothetical protein Tco_1256963, partial [Tanacetum coccineum]